MTASARLDSEWVRAMQPRRIATLRFTPEREREFREHQRRRYRYPRAALFIIFCIAFAASPWGNVVLFMAEPAVNRLLSLIELGLVAPLMALAAALTLMKVPQMLRQSVQSAAVFTVFTTVLFLRYLALTGHIQYPAQMLGVVIIAVALFGGFSWRRVLNTSLLFFGAGIALEYSVGSPDSLPHLQAYTLCLMALIAALGAYTLELIGRLGWLSYRYASSLARTDSLTGLANRHLFNRMFPRTLRAARREGCALGLMMLDVDQFKSINDRHGHLFGDEVLRAVGQALDVQAARRPFDLLVRYGGEEIVVVWYDIAAENLEARVQAVLDAVRALQLRAPDGSTVNITASAGALWWRPDADTPAEKILQRADDLLYQAKTGGRDCARVELRTP